MSIPEHVRSNFQTLLTAAKNDALALMECKDAKTGETLHVICAASINKDKSVDFTPFGHMCPDGNPYDAYIPPEVAP